MLKSSLINISFYLVLLKRYLKFYRTQMSFILSLHMQEILQTTQDRWVVDSLILHMSSRS